MMQPRDTFTSTAAFHDSRLKLIYRTLREATDFNPMVLHAIQTRGKDNPRKLELRFAVVEDNLDEQGLCTLVCIDCGGEDGNELTITVPLLNLGSIDPFEHTTETGVTYELQVAGRLGDLVKPPTMPRFLEKYNLLRADKES